MQQACWATMDGNEAAARVAHALSEVIAIYPITPSSGMAELSDAWSAVGRKNIWGDVPQVVEMQSEAGAAAALHGAVTKGALGTTFTASQGLLLMIPNMYKIAGELTPAVIHVAARAVATHALSIFGDHSDVMGVRQTGWALLNSTSVQEAQDLALISHAATLRTRVPFLHFFDGFRTSHEENKIRLLDESDIRALVNEDDVAAHRLRGLTPDAPQIRGTAQNPDTFFQAREASNKFYNAVPNVVDDLFVQLENRVGRRYRSVEYYGDPEAERVVVVMGSAWSTVKQAVDDLLAQGEKVGVILPRLYRPFPEDRFIEALPESAKSVAVLDRTKEPGSVGEPLFTDVVATLAESGRAMPRVIGGRYGLSSKEFTPAMAVAVFTELGKFEPKKRFTVGIVDDVTNLSLPVNSDIHSTADQDALKAVFFGLGADGTVGSAKNNVKIIGADEGRFAQGYFVYDSRKSGGTTISHLRFADHPIDSPYLIDHADFVAVHQFELLSRMSNFQLSKPGATILLNSPYGEDTWNHLPEDLQRAIIDRDLKVWVINATKVARDAGMGQRINTVMQPCFFYLSGVVPREEAIDRIKTSVEKTYGKRGRTIVQRNFDAIDAAIPALFELQIPEEINGVQQQSIVPDSAPDFVQRVTGAMLRDEGDLLPVSALPPDGTWPLATTKYEKRGIAYEIPIWDESLCIDCGKCAMACPHAAIRVKVAPNELLSQAPEGFRSKDFRDRLLTDHQYIVQVAPDDCTGCAICVDVCPARSKSEAKHKALNMANRLEHLDTERENYDFFLGLPEVNRSAVRHEQVKGAALLQPLFEFSGACSGCGETPYIRLLSQLFGDRLLVANATGCSSIYSGNLPTTPYATNDAGRGPAWSNSLFEDNAEFGYGMRLAADQQTAEARRLLGVLSDKLPGSLAQEILDADQTSEEGIFAQRERVGKLETALAELDDPAAAKLLTNTGALVKKSVWIIGGDGWAYDIGFGGLDHVLASGRNVNILVLDTEVYSNTGGQASKSTPRGAVAKFAAAGKNSGKKDLGMIAQLYGNVYVAQISMGANQQQTVRALAEAEAWDGPSLIIAYSTCIAHGIDMETSMSHQGDAVATGYWPLYRFRPDQAKPLKMDSKAPTGSVIDFMSKETRFNMLRRTNPEAAEQLGKLAQADAEQKWQYYSALAGMSRKSEDGEEKPAAPRPAQSQDRAARVKAIMERRKQIAKAKGEDK